MTAPGWLREPLVHFLIAGGALFALSSWIHPAPAPRDTVVIGREDVRELLQARAQLYDAETFDALIDGMSDEERAALVREAALAEILWREGRELGLPATDPVVRQRVIQQMRQLAIEDVAADIALTDQQVRDFFDANPARYAADPLVSFSHVYVRDSEAEARTVLAALRSSGAADAGGYGDRFLYQRNYASASRGEIASQFGEDFADALFAREPGGWAGPVPSQHGWHLVLLRERSAASTPDFDAVAARVREDALAEARALAAGEALDRLLERYTVETRGDLAP